MARTYAKVALAIWADDDFRRLSVQAQALYFKLLTSPTLNPAGVADWRPKRLAMLTGGQTPEDVERAASELARALYIVVDDDSEEVLLRSFIRHDGVLKNVKVTSAMMTNYAAIASTDIRGVLVHELQRLYKEDPGLSGWTLARERLTDRALDPAELSPYSPQNQALSDTPPDTPSHALSDAPSHALSDTPSDGVSEALSDTPCHILQPTTYNLQPTTSSVQTAAIATVEGRKTRHTYPADFEAFWKVYPRRQGKRKAAAAFKRAKQRAPLETIMAGAARYRDDPNRVDRFTKHAEGWLNGDGWEDDPLPPRDGGERATGSRSRDWLEAGAALLDDTPATYPQLRSAQ